MAEEQVQITAILKDKFSNNLNTINKSIKTLETSLGNLSKTLGPLASRFTVLGAALGAIGLSRLASDAEETASKFDAVFKELATVTNVFVNELATSVGRSRNEIRSFLAELQNTFVPLGFARDKAAELSKELTTLAIDVASFNNATDQEVLRSFQSAIVGNIESVRKYGIVLTQARLEQEALAAGFTKGIDALTETEKAQLRFNVILKSTVDAQGDAVRTQSSFQNSLKATAATAEELAIILGSVLNDSIKPLLISTRDIIRELTAWAKANKATIQAVLQLTGQVLLAVAAFKGLQVINAILPVITAFSGVVAATATNLGKLVTSMASLATGGGNSAAAIRRNAVAIKTFREGLNSLKGALKSVGIGLFIAALTDVIITMKQINNVSNNLKQVLADTGRSFASIQGEIEGARKELGDLAEVDFSGVGSTASTLFRVLTGEAAAAAEALLDLNVQIELRADLENATIATTKRAIDGLRDMAEEAGLAAEEQDKLKDAIAGMNAILAQQGNVAENARIALVGGATELIGLYEKQVITLNQLIALSERRTDAVKGTVAAFIEENKQAKELKENATIINALFSEITDSFFKQDKNSKIFEQIKELNIEDAEGQVQRLSDALANIRRTGESGGISIDIDLKEGTKDIDVLQGKLNDVISSLRDSALVEFAENQSKAIERTIDDLSQLSAIKEQQIEQELLLGNITQAEADNQSQQLRIDDTLKEIEVAKRLLEVQQNLNNAGTGLEGGEARKKNLEEIYTLTARLQELENGLIATRAEITNEDLKAANAARDAFIARAEGLATFIDEQQKAIENGSVSFNTAQAAVIAQQQELQKSYEETSIVINETFGEGTELALQYNAALEGTNALTQELELNSATAFTTLDRVLQQTTSTLVNGLTNSMSGFFESIITGSKDGKQAFGDLLRDMAQNFAQFAAQTIAKLLIIRAISAFIPGGFAAQSVGIGLNSGGLVPGSGPDRDSVPAHLTPGEYVIPRKRVAQYGAGVMNALRNGQIPAEALRKYSSGKRNIRTNALQSGGQVTDQSIGLQKSGEGLVLPIMQADDNNAETIFNGGESAVLRWFSRNNTQIKSILDSSES